MREISARAIKDAVYQLAIDTAFTLPSGVKEALRNALDRETSPRGRSALELILKNAEIAQQEKLAICQDCGLAVLFIEIGQDVKISGCNIRGAIDEAILDAYQDGYLRKSVCHPFTRANTKTNTPAIIHYDIVPGERVRIMFAAKGGGSENMSRVVMLKPADGKDGIIREVVNTVDMAGPNPCPPTIVGVGIGGDFELAAIMAKKAAVMRNPLDRNPDPELAELEDEILERINKLGHGPQGLGGNITSLGVNILMHPCHIASLPLAINLQCVAARHKEVIL